jgi:predicted ribosomally synthesized peptide with SipW-like signal peptide
VLAGLGTIGIASAGAGLGTTAFFSDEEAVSASLQAGRVDLLVDYRATYNPWMSAAEATERGLLGDDTTARPIPGSESILIGEAPMLSKVEDEIVGGTDGMALSNTEWTDFTNNYDACENPMGLEYVDGDEEIMFSLVDIKPKDEGEVTLSLHICDNPSYAWMDVFARNDEDNTVYEPEGKHDDDSEGELDDFLYVEAWMDADCSNTVNGDETPFFQGSLASLVAAIEEQDDERGLMLETAEGEKCFVGLHCLAFYWYLPCYVEQDDGMGFGQLPSATHSTLADELAAKYGIDVEDIDVNVVQTDSVEFGFTFHVEQCRHNMMDPKFRKISNDGWGKNSADGDRPADEGLSSVPLEGKIRKDKSPNASGNFSLKLGADQQYKPIDEGVAKPFTLSFDGTTMELEYEGHTLSSNDFAAGGDGLVVTTRSLGKETFSKVENLRLEVPDSGIDTTSSEALVPTLDEGSNKKYCAFLDVDGLSEGFTLSGDLTLAWNENSSDEQPAVYFFAGKTGSA